MKWIVVWLAAVGLSLSMAATGSAQRDAAQTADRRNVVVPSVGSDYFAAYDGLHAMGLRVTIPRPLSLGPFVSLVLGGTSPAGGRRVRAGTAVTLIPGCCAGLGSPAVPTGPLPSAVVPNFVGKPASVASAWTTSHGLYFAARLFPLVAGDAPHLLENYGVASQRPARGTTLTLGVGQYDARTKEGSFWPTPLTIKAVQRLVPRRVYEYSRAAFEAVASGRGDAARWVLVGRQLRVTLPRAVDPHARTLVKVGLTCGDDADFAGGKLNPDTDRVWADVAYTQVRVPGKTRQITVRLNRDVARRVNACELEINPGSFSFENTLLMSAMVLRHGTPVGCQPGRLERTLLRQGPVLVTIARLNQDIGNALAYRACLGPRRSLRPIGHGGAGPGSSGESRDSELFTAAGPWLAWTEVADSNSLGPYPPTLHALNLQSGRQKVTFGDGNGEEISAAAETLGRVVRLAVGPTGTIAWVLDRTQEVNATTTPASAELNVRPVSGPVVTIDRASTAGEIAGLRFSSDGQTLSWTHDGVARTAPLPR